MLTAEMVSLLIEMLDGPVVEVDGDRGDERDQRGLVGGVTPGEVGDSKTGFTLGYLRCGSLVITSSGQLCSGAVLKVGREDPL